MTVTTSKLTYGTVTGPDGLTGTKSNFGVVTGPDGLTMTKLSIGFVIDPNTPGPISGLARRRQMIVS